MKKLLFLTLAILLMAGVAVFADGGSGLVQKAGVYVSTKTVDCTTNAVADPYAVIITEVDTNDDILGYSVTATKNADGAGAVASLWDDDSATTSRVAAPFDEIEAGSDQSSAARWFPYPKRITTGLVLGAENPCIITIYYIEN